MIHASRFGPPSAPRRTSALSRLAHLRLTLVAAGAALLSAACSTPPTGAPHAAEATSLAATQTTERFDSTVALATFDEVWRIVHATHYDAEFGGVDWEGVRDELRPRVDSVTTTPELRSLLGEMVGRLGLSHYVIIPGGLRLREPSAPEDAADRSAGATDTAGGEPDLASSADEEGAAGTVGVTVRLVEGRAVVTAVRDGSPADGAGIRRGWVIERIGRRSVAQIVGDLDAALDSESSNDDSGAAPRDGWRDFVATTVLMEMLDRPIGATIDLELLDGDDKRHAVSLASVEKPVETVELGALRLSGEFSARLVSDDELVAALGPDAPPQRVGLIAFTVWIVPVVVPFHRAVDSFRAGDGIIVDLRGNPGGIVGLVMGIGGHFVDEPRSLGSLRNRAGTLEFRANPRRTDADGSLVKPFDGPVAILVDGLSASTSEIFAGGMQSIGRARVFGATSAGAALPAGMATLPNGDTLMHVIADFILPDGTRLEGRGVVPDEPVALSRADLLAGDDPVLLAALRWIAASTAPNTDAVAQPVVGVAAAAATP